MAMTPLRVPLAVLAILLMTFLGRPALADESAEPAFAFTFKGLSLSVGAVKNAQAPEVRIMLQAAKMEGAEIFEVEGPPRLVVDLFGVDAPKTHNLEADVGRFLKRVRVGVHPAKTRVVFDLDPDVSIQPTWITEGDKVEILLRESKQESAEPLTTPAPVALLRVTRNPTEQPTGALAPPTMILADEEPKTTTEIERPLEIEPPIEATPTPAEPQLVMVPEETPSPIEPEVLSPVLATPPRVEEAPVVEVAAVVEPEKPSLPKPQTLLSIDFPASQEAKGPQAVLRFSKRVEYQLQQSESPEYELRLNEAIAEGDHLLLPFFPPQESEGLTFVQPEPHPLGLRIKIGVEPGYRLSAIPNGAEIHLVLKKSKFGNARR